MLTQWCIQDFSVGGVRCHSGGGSKPWNAKSRRWGFGKEKLTPSLPDGVPGATL